MLVSDLAAVNWLLPFIVLDQICGHSIFGHQFCLFCKIDGQKSGAQDIKLVVAHRAGLLTFIYHHFRSQSLIQVKIMPLNCPKCHQKFTFQILPKLLGCFHVMCQKCIETAFSSGMYYSKEKRRII